MPSTATPVRRGAKGIRNLQEGRHGLAERIFHGRKSQLFQRYYEGMEDQLGALGIVLNCLVLWNTIYIDDALNQLREQGYPLRDEDVARLSPFICKHINVHGRYSFHRPELTGARRALRDPDAAADEDDDEDRADHSSVISHREIAAGHELGARAGRRPAPSGWGGALNGSLPGCEVQR